MHPTFSALIQNDLRNKVLNLRKETHYLLSDHHPKVLCLNRPARPTAGGCTQSATDKKFKPNLQTPAGQARLLHDLANIELQAMELGLRTLYEFPDAPSAYRRGLAEIVIEESEHFLLCLNFIEKCGFQFGNWPTHFKLWDATSQHDELVDRLFIVHCYLEASGLDASDILLRKLAGVVNEEIRAIIHRIAHDEIRHVEFGLSWYRKLATECGLANAGIGDRLKALTGRLPSRHSQLSHRLRLQAGFSAFEIQEIENYRENK